MPELLYVEADIRIEALRQELARMGSGEVAVVLPKQCSQLESLPRLRLLQRQSQALGQELALVTWNPTIRQNAKRLGIPVYSSDAALQGRLWRMDSPAPYINPNNVTAGLPTPPHWRKESGSPKIQVAARPSSFRSRQRRLRAAQRYRRPTSMWLRVFGYLLVGLFLVVFLGGFVYFVLPAATVTLVPGQRTVEATVLLTADPQVGEADLEQGLLPARLMETTVEDTGSVATTGSGWSDVDRAEGKVVFTNQTNRTVRIPAGTIVSTSTGDRVDFRILEELEIPGPIGTQAEVGMEAVETGEQGNVQRSNQITTVAGALRTQVLVTNPEPTQGGSTTHVRLVTQADKDRLIEQVKAAISGRALEELTPSLRADEWLTVGTIQPHVVAQFFSHFNDEPTDELDLTLRVLIQGVAISRSASEAAAMVALRAAVPERGQLVVESIRFSIEPNMVVSGRTLRYAVKVSGNYVIPIDTRAVSRTVTGLGVDEAARQLQEEWLLAKEPTFYQDPGWFATLPQIASRIQVRVELSEAARSVQ